METQEQEQQIDNIQETHKVLPGWMQAEVESVKKRIDTYESDEVSLILEEGKITEFVIDVDKEWKAWTADNGVLKKIIPVLHKGEQKIFWLSTRNPLYTELVLEIEKGIRQFKVMRTGQKKDTRYTLVKE